MATLYINKLMNKGFDRQSHGGKVESKAKVTRNNFWTRAGKREKASQSVNGGVKATLQGRGG
jgi:hypothetical protein